MTEYEIREFIEMELEYLNLNDDEKEKYVKFIKKMDNYYTNISKSEINVKATFLEKIETCMELFKTQGFEEEKIILFTKKFALESDRKNFETKVNFLRNLNILEKTVYTDSMALRYNMEATHAKKMHLVSNNNTQYQTKSVLLHENINDFENRFKVKLGTLTKKYPITEETKTVWNFIAIMTDEKLEEYFGVNRETLSKIYPTTIDEVTTIHKIAALNDEEIKSSYGITREELLKKYPLNKDTLKALISIQSTKPETINKIFKQSKEEVLNIRTITTDMIKIANANYLRLKRGTYTKEELVKQLSKRTNQND